MCERRVRLQGGATSRRGVGSVCVSVVCSKHAPVRLAACRHARHTANPPRRFSTSTPCASTLSCKHAILIEQKTSALFGLSTRRPECSSPGQADSPAAGRAPLARPAPVLRAPAVANKQTYETSWFADEQQRGRAAKHSTLSGCTRSDSCASRVGARLNPVLLIAQRPALKRHRLLQAATSAQPHLKARGRARQRRRRARLSVHLGPPRPHPDKSIRL